MAEIPEEILKRAREAVDEGTLMEPMGGMYHSLVEAFSKALMAERAAQIERDAGIAEAHVICDWSKLPGKAVDDTFGKQIAAAIREQKQ